MINLRDLASPCSFKKSIILAMPSMGEHSVSARIGKKNNISYAEPLGPASEWTPGLACSIPSFGDKILFSSERSNDLLVAA